MRMSLTVYNSLSRRKEPFETIEPGKVRMYVCGITVYEYFHIGNARAYLVWDVVRRYLIWRGYQVRYVQNFTDIDDKILRRAQAEGVSMQAIAERYIEAYFEDMDRLNVLRADDYPRATHSLDGIQRLIHELEQRGYAYPAGGDVYYAVRRFPDYGKLSGRRLDEMQAGASGRLEEEPEAQKKDPPGVAAIRYFSWGLMTSFSIILLAFGDKSFAPLLGGPLLILGLLTGLGDISQRISSRRLKKRDPFDFALWKMAKPGEPAWQSPWGPGRPGWHIECSAMVRASLGETIDIHAGGVDLQFPHHENEIAQSEAVTGKPLARYWMHNGFVNIDGEKMSKSLGNFRTARELMAQYDPMAFRLFVLQAQYRKPIDFTAEGLEAAENSWKTLKEGLLFGPSFAEKLGWSEPSPEQQLDAEAVNRFRAAMDDDFNSPVALSVLFELAKDLRRERNLLDNRGTTDTAPEVLARQWHTLVHLAQVLGLEAQPDAEGAPAPTSLAPAEIELQIQQRQAARQARNFAEADRIRNELAAQGILLIDQPDGSTRWRASQDL